MPLGHHHVIDHVAAQVVGRGGAAVGDLPVADAAAALIVDDGVGLRPVGVIVVGVDNMDGDLALITQHSVVCSFPAYIHHLQLHLVQVIGQDGGLPDGIGEHSASAVSGADTGGDVVAVDAQHQVHILSPLQALFNGVGVDGDTQGISGLSIAIVDVPL